MNQPVENIKKYPAYLHAIDEILKQFTYGDVIPKAWLSQEMEMPEPVSGTFSAMKAYQFKMMAALEPLKEILLSEHKMLLYSVRGEGYLIVAPEQQTDVVWDKMRRVIHKELTRAVQGLFHLDVARLSDPARKHNADYQAKLASLRAHNSKQLS